MIPEPVLDGRRVESLVQELHRYAPHYTPDLNLTDEQSPGPALMRIFAHLAETVLVRLGRTPHKHFVAFLDRLGINLLPARPARAAVTFRLATGLNTAVEVPASTRVTAAGADDDIPFETTGTLVAIPAALTAAFGTDPDKDTIYAPPPGFLAQQIRPPSELSYTVQAFAESGAKRLQLDHVTDLTPGSFLRMGGTARAVVGALPDGNIVTLKDPLAADVEAQTVVTPIRDFEVFDGIDLQEHVLYIGHADVFTIKEAVEITLDVRLAGVPTSAPLTPFDVAWQFWTKIEGGDSLDNEEHWHDLASKSDTTAGFSSTGLIVLTKPKDLEIKEREVGGIKSRWIRAKLLDKLPAEGRALPEIDTVEVAVTSVQSDPDEEPGIPADQGFHNATPLDVGVKPDVGFFPFGLEPRQFDQFYVASKEAFSKARADVTLRFELDLQTLATPALAVSASLGLRAYSIGLRRKVYELQVDTGDWEVLGDPAATPIAERKQGSGFLPVEDSAPSAVIDGGDVYVFVNSEDSLAADNAPNRIWCCLLKPTATPSVEPAWNDLGAPGPPPGRIGFSPAAIRFGAAVRVFVVARDGNLYSRAVTAEGAPAPGTWLSHGSPPAVTLMSTPFLRIAGNSDLLLVFVNGNKSNNGNDEKTVHRLTLRLDLTSEWLSLTQRGVFFAAVSRPFAVPFGASVDAKVFVFGLEQVSEKWKLFECDTSQVVNEAVEWVDLRAPSTSVDQRQESEAYAPAGFLERPDGPITQEGKHIFLRGSDKHLYELVDGDTPSDPPRWRDRSRQEDPPLRDSPAVDARGVSTTTTIRVVSASERNSLVTWEFALTSATIPANADSVSVRLDENASDADGHYTGDFAITAGQGSPLTGNPVLAYDGALRILRLANPLLVLPNSTSACNVDGESVGIATDHADLLFALHDPAPGTRRALQLRVDDVPVGIDVYSRLTGVIRLTAGIPAGATAFVLHAEIADVRHEYAPLEDRASFPELSWEYWNGQGWLSLPVSDRTRSLLSNGDVTFRVPPSIEPTEVAGQESFWIRVRLVGGDYGRETFRVENGKVISEKSTLRPPKVRSLRIHYESPAVPPGACLTFNNLDYLDQTAACQLGGARFRPFEPLERYRDRSLTVYLGFDKPFKTGPVRLLVDAAEREFDESRPPELDWRFRKDRQWKELDAEDGTVALNRQGLLTLSASEELTREGRFGQSLYWIRGSLRTDRGSAGADYRPLLRGIFLNTVWAVQGETITEEIVGSSDGEPNQLHKLMHADVLDGEDIRVREALSAEEQERIEREDGKDSVVVREDLGGTWVRWRETLALFDAGPEDRCYLVDRAAGRLQFGDGIHGRIPPAGIDNVRAFRYRTGGGAAGNVAAGKIEALGTAVAGVESVFNPTPAGGGSDKATTEAMLKIGPRRISHHDRAVSAEDFEELAQEASRQVAKVRCLGITNLVRLGGKPDPCDESQRHQALPALGWVSLIVVPDSPDPHPCPSLELRRAVKDFLRRRAPSVLAASDRIVVRPPDYVVVGVDADLYVTSLEQAAAVETQARKALETFLHPLRGGADGTGWEFGRPLWKSDVFALLERIDLIDRVENLQFRFRRRTDPDRVVIGPNELIASGQHQLGIKKA